MAAGNEDPDRSDRSSEFRAQNGKEARLIDELLQNFLSLGAAEPRRNKAVEAKEVEALVENTTHEQKCLRN